MDEQTQQKKSVLDQLSPKTIFIGGIVVSILVICTIGFFILLFSNFSGGKGYDRAAAPVLAARPSVPSPISAKVVVTDEDYYKGDKDAEITIVEFSDFECPFCKRFHPTMQQVVDEYGGKVKWVYRHFPLTSIHPKAPKEAEAAECAGELGGNDGFWAFTDKLFEVTPANNGLDLAQLPIIAQQVGLNKKKFETCLNSGKYAAKVQQQANQATKAGARGTPYSIIISGDTHIPLNGALPFEQVKSTIDTILNQ